MAQLSRIMLQMTISEQVSIRGLQAVLVLYNYENIFNKKLCKTLGFSDMFNVKNGMV